MDPREQVWGFHGPTGMELRNGFCIPFPSPVNYPYWGSKLKSISTGDQGWVVLVEWWVKMKSPDLY